MARFDLFDGSSTDNTTDQTLPVSNPSGFDVPKDVQSPNVYPSTPTYENVNNAYQQYLGRSAGQDEYSNFWANTPTYLSGIQNSAEAQAYKNRPSEPTGAAPSNGPTGGNYAAWFNSLVSGKAPTSATLQSLGPELQKYGISLRPNAAGIYGKIQLPTGEIIDVIQGADAGGKAWQWLTPDQAGASSGYGASVASPQTSVFSDPATQQYEQLLNAMIGRLNTPYEAPNFQPAVDYLKSYFQQLQGPAYTPQQMDLMQTQALDPQTVQRDAARQQIIERFGAQGVPPSSGIVQKAILDSDQNFEKLRTTTQAGFANNAIGMQKQQQAQAASLGPQIAALEQAQQSANEGRQLKATDLGGVIPQMSWDRITGANQMIQPINTGDLLSQLTAAQNTAYGQSAGYSTALMQLLMQLMGG